MRTELKKAAIPILPETAALCTCYGLKGLGAIASGSEEVQPVSGVLRPGGIPTTAIGGSIPSEGGPGLDRGR